MKDKKVKIQVKKIQCENLLFIKILNKLQD